MYIEELKDLIEKSNNIVFFGGAGVSTESGIPDFRSATGLYNQKHQSGYSPEYMLSHEFYEKHPGEFANYYKTNLIHPEVKPNRAHYALAKLEEMGKLSCVITQNIDSLHQKAGSKNVIEIHGNLRDFYCTSCNKAYDLDHILKTDTADYCTECGGLIRPDIVLYQEGLDMEKFARATCYIQNADMMIVGGTSLAVYPAASLVQYYQGSKLVLINRDQTSYDDFASYVFKGSIGEILGGALDV